MIQDQTLDSLPLHGGPYDGGRVVSDEIFRMTVYIPRRTEGVEGDHDGVFHFLDIAKPKANSLLDVYEIRQGHDGQFVYQHVNWIDLRGQSEEA